jgi:predicted anti-sigma-YlaC factor YlaD
VSYAENVAVPEQDAVLFREMLGKALAIDPDVAPARRLANLIAQRRAQWLLSRIEDLFLIVPETTETGGDR